MTVVFLVRYFYPHIGGVETHTLEVTRRLIQKGYKVTIVTEKLPGSKPVDKIPLSPKLLERLKIYYIPVGGDDWFKKFRIWKWMIYHQNLFKDADIVHAHDVFFWYLPFRLLYRDKSVFTTFHGYEGVYPPTLKAILVRKLCEKLSKGNICVGQFIEKWYHTKADYITYGGVNPILSQYKKQTQENLKIAFIGRLEKDTGIDIYVHALKHLRDEGHTVDFVAIGDGSLRNEVEEVGIVKGFTKGVEKEIPKYDFIFASSYLSILEAFMAKRLVFAVYDNPLKEDYLRKTPFGKFLVSTNSSYELSTQLENLLNKPETVKQMTSKAYAWAREQTWDQVADLYINLWRE